MEPLRVKVLGDFSPEEDRRLVLGIGLWVEAPVLNNTVAALVVNQDGQAVLLPLDQISVLPDPFP